MAIELLPSPNGGAPLGNADYNYQNVQVQALMYSHNPQFVLSEWFTLVEPEIKQGVIISHAGGLYSVNDNNEAITGAPVDGRVFVKLTEAANILTASFVTSMAGYTFNDTYNGWYHADGTQIMQFILIKENSTEYKKFRFFDYLYQLEDDFTAVNLYPFAGMNTSLQDDSKDSLPLPAGVTYWNFGSPNLANSTGVMPTIRNNTKFIQSIASPPFFSNRGCIYISEGYIAYIYTFGNEMTFGIRFLPNFIYNIATDVIILDTRSNSSLNEDFIRLSYNNTTDKIDLWAVDALGTHDIKISTNAYVSNVALQIEHTIFVNISKAANNVDMYVNGTLIINGVNGTKTTTGNGITNVNLPARTSITLGSDAFGTSGMLVYAGANIYYQDMFFKNSYDTVQLADWTPATQKCYYSPTWISGNKQNCQIDANGNAGFRGLSCETLSVNSVDSGAGQMKTKIIPIGAWNMDSTTTVSITHGIADFTKIMPVSFIIRTDAGSDIVPLNDDRTVGGYVVSIQATVISLSRIAGGIFDNANYDDTTINRGFLFIPYLI